jgi:hypothetical protein
MPSSQQPLGIPGANRPYAIMAMVAGGLVLLVLLSCITVGMIMGPKGGAADPAVAAAKAELDKFKAEMAAAEQKRKELDREREQKEFFLKTIADLTQKFEADRRRRDDEYERLARNSADQKLISEAKAKRDREKEDEDRRKADLEDQKRKADRDHADALARQKQLSDAAAQAAQNAALQQAIINASAPRYWYHPRYYYPW